MFILEGSSEERASARPPRAWTELTLSDSRLEGDPITINSNREYLRRAFRLGFRDALLYGNDVPMLCDDGRRHSYGRRWNRRPLTRL